MSELAIIYQCPGEPQPISHAVHLGRLVRFYPPCRTCAHRDQTGTLSAKQVKQLVESRRRATSGDLFYDEGMAGVESVQLDARLAREAAAALGLHLLHTAPAPAAPTVAIAGDRRPIAAELIEAVAEGLRFAGCRVFDVGSATAPCLTAAAEHLDADGAILVGNAPSRPHTVALKFWGHEGRPLSLGSQLEAVRQTIRTGINRPVRKFGTLHRFQAEPLYLARLEPSFHALRPLRVVLDTCCRPFREYLDKLAGRVACQFVAPSLPGAKAERADFRMWIDGDGETCRLWDEQGKTVSGERLLAILARPLLAEMPGQAVVVEDTASAETEQALVAAGGRVVRSGAARAEIDRAMRADAAILAGGSSGRIWFGGSRPSADALQTLSHLLVLLSASDQPLSQVLSQTIFENA